MKKISKWGVALVLFFTLSLFSLPVIMAEDWQSVADTTVQLFIKYLSIDTTNPPGDVSEAAEFLHQMLQKEGISSELIWTDKKTGRVNVLARLEGNGDKPPLLMLNHMDTVPVDRSGWSVDPFKGIKKNGYIYGRGALDMKNFGIVQLMSMILLKRNNVPLERDVFFFAFADEETSGALGSGWIAENKWQDIEAEYVLDDTPYNNALLRNTISLTVLKGYVGNPPKSNVIPGKAEAVLDCRLLPGQNSYDFVKQLEKIIDDPRVKLEYIERPVESIVSLYETELFQVIETETKALFPDSETVPTLVIYGTDSRFYRRRGASCYGFFPGPVSMEEYRTIHGNDERIRESSLRSAVRIYYNVVKSFCKSMPNTL